MRRLRWLTTAAVGVGATALLAAFSLPEGVDGKMVDDWSALPAAESWTPAESTCHATAFLGSPTYELYKPLDCAEGHLIETVHVGTLKVERETPPPQGSRERREAYRECLDETKELLGADWRTGRVWLGLALPSSKAWAGGARWFRCDVWEVKDKDDPDDVYRKGSLKDALRGDRPLGYGCYRATVKDDEVRSMAAVACSKPHNAEFAGLFDAPDVPYPKSAKERDDLGFDGCRGVAAKFAKVPNDGNFFFRTGLIITPYSEEEWEQGNRGIRCHLWLDKNVSRSLKGAGPGALPAT
jgi:hypothetical protein